MAGPVAGPAAVRGGEPEPWPELRDDLQLHPGPVSSRGAPTWTLYDPAANRFLRIGWLEFEVLSRWVLGTPRAIADAIAAETTMTVDHQRVESVARFLAFAGLTRPPGAEGTRGLLARSLAGRPPLWEVLLHNYLFFRIPLLRPDRLLTRVAPRLRFVFSRAFVAAAVLLAALGLVSVLRRLEEFGHGFSHVTTLEGAALVGAALLAAKLAHEFGHALAAKHFGCRVPAMGIGFMAFHPVFWTDTTQAWKLQDRRQRLVIDAAGVVAELVLASLASLAWGWMADGPLRTAAALLAGSAWVLTLTINVSPFMRYDGYYLLADFLDEPNLQPRSFALARHWLRQALLGVDEPPPEALPPARELLFLVYAAACWAYRFVLYLGIALLVYRFFFKALGLFLMLVEVWWFMLRPVIDELGQWARRARAAQDARQLGGMALRPLLLLAAALSALFIPWQGRVHAPAVLMAERQATLYATEAAYIAAAGAANGQEVAQGQAVLHLFSPELDHKRARAARQMDILRARAAAGALELGTMQQSQLDAQELARVHADLEGLRAAAGRLTLAAPFAGRVSDIPTYAVPGALIPAREPLAVITAGRPTAVAYAAEADLWRLRVGARALFYPRAGDRGPIALVVTDIDVAATRDLPYAEIASTHGGELPARKTADDRLAPETAVYRVALEWPGDEAASAPTPPRLETGRVVIAAERQSLARRIWNFAVVGLLRESGWF